MKMKDRNWCCIAPECDTDLICANEGQYVTGQPIGLLQTHSWMPKPPGHVSCKASYPYPVRHMPVRELIAESLIANEQGLIPNLVEAGERIEREFGARIIGSSCGYFGNYQKEVADCLHTPTYLSSVIQAPWALSAMQPEQKLGVICADETKMTFELMESCGCTRADYERCVVYGAQDNPMFHFMRQNLGHYNIAMFGEELVALAKKLVIEHPEVGAILLECTEMPSYAAPIQAATNLPVYDYITLLNFLKETVCHKPHYGFI